MILFCIFKRNIVFFNEQTKFLKSNFTPQKKIGHKNEVGVDDVRVRLPSLDSSECQPSYLLWTPPLWLAET